MNLSIISMILRSLGSVVQMSDVFGSKAAQLAPILNTLAGFAELPEKTKPFQEALLAQVRTWVAENRGPTDQELAQFKATVDDLDTQLREIRDRLKTEGQPLGGM